MTTMEHNNPIDNYTETIKQLNSISSNISCIVTKSMVLSNSLKSYKNPTNEAILLLELSQSIVKVSQGVLSAVFTQQVLKEFVVIMSNVLNDLAILASEMSEIISSKINDLFEEASKIIKRQFEKQENFHLSILKIEKTVSHITLIPRCVTSGLEEILSQISLMSSIVFKMLGLVLDTIEDQQNERYQSNRNNGFKRDLALNQSPSEHIKNKLDRESNYLNNNSSVYSITYEPPKYLSAAELEKLGYTFNVKLSDLKEYFLK